MPEDCGDDVIGVVLVGDGKDEKESVGLCGSRACISVQRGKVQPMLRAL